MFPAGVAALVLGVTTPFGPVAMASNLLLARIQFVFLGGIGIDRAFRGDLDNQGDMVADGVHILGFVVPDEDIRVADVEPVIGPVIVRVGETDSGVGPYP